MYVDALSQSYRSPSGVDSAFQRSLLVKTPEYCCLNKFWRQHAGNRVLNFLRRRPDVLQVHWLPVLVGTEWLVEKVDVDCTGERVRNDERR